MNEQTELETLRRENTHLRALVPKLTGKCIHCGLENMAMCKSGFPGCAWADDIMCAEDETSRRLLAELETLRRQNAAMRSAFADIRDAVLNGRNQLEGYAVEPDVINAVLGIIDDNTPIGDAGQHYLTPEQVSDAIKDVKPPTEWEGLQKAEYFKAGARAVVFAINKALPGNKPL